MSEIIGTTEEKENAEFKQEEYSKAYYSKEVSANDVYPEFISREVNNALTRAKNHIDGNSVNFAFITDIHHTCFPSDEIRLKRAVNVYSALKKQLGPIPLFVGGDHIGDGCTRYKKAMFKQLSSALEGINYFPVNGNHDDGTIWGMLHPDASNGSDFLTHKELFSAFYGELENKGCNTEGEDKLYYSYDDVNNKIRYVVLDVNDVPYIYDENNNLKYNGQDLFILSHQQLDWLGNTALKFEEEGWSVILVLHGIKADDDQTVTHKHLAVLKELAGGFKNHGKVEFEYGEGDLRRKIDFDFSDYVKADIVGYFAGDAHKNLCFRDKFDIPYIVTANAFPFYYDPPTVERYDADPTEICINLITVNKAEHKIYVTNIGYGQDYVCEF